MKPLSIAFFGSSLVSAYWNGAATYYRGVLQALAARGHRITFYEPDAFDRQAHRDIPDPDWARVVVYPVDGTDGVDARARRGARRRPDRQGERRRRVRRAAGSASSGDQAAAVRSPCSGMSMRRRRSTGSRADPDDPFRALIPAYDMVLTYGGGPPVVAGYRSGSARECCVPIYNGLDPATHHPVPPEPRFACDLGLVANRLPDRERRIEEFFLAAAAELPTGRFLLGGNGWADKPMPPNIGYIGHVYTRDHNAFNARRGPCLNVSRDSMAAYGYSPATRVFEAAGAGACIITDAWEGIELNSSSRDARSWSPRTARRSPSILRGSRRSEARRIGEAARARALAEHTYDAARRLCWKTCIGGQAGVSAAALPPAGATASHRHSRAVDHLVLGQRPRDDLSQPDAGALRGAATRCCFWNATSRGTAPTAIAVDLPFGSVRLYHSVGELRDRWRDALADADLVIVGSYVPDGIAVAQLVQIDRVAGSSPFTTSIRR